MARNHALLIGINKYPMLDPRYELGGCVGDAKLMKSILQLRFGFQPEEFIELYDLDATQSAIMSAMEKVVNACQQDDCVYFHFAGHGSQKLCSDGTESSGLDSTIMPSDSGRQKKPNRDIPDDDIGEWLERLSKKTDNITLVFDCCHSGTITRDLTSAKARSVPADLRSPDEMNLVPNLRSKTRDLGGSNFLQRSDKLVVFSGCRDDELANEYTIHKDGHQLRHGALTYWLSQTMLAAKPKTTYQDLYESVSEQITTLFPTQHPQIEGRRDRVIFGSEHVEPIKYFNLQLSENGDVTFDGGAAHGVVVGSTWSVFPPGTNDTDGLTPLATATVTTVNAMTSELAVEPKDVKLSSGARCLMVSTPVTVPKFSVSIEDAPQDTAPDLTSRIENSNLLTIASDTLTADATLHHADTGWTALSRDEHPMIPFQALISSDDHSRLIDNLETKARAQNVFALTNPQSTLNVAFVLHRSTDGGVSWEKVDGNTRFIHGDRIAFEVINNDDRDLFVSVLDIGLTGKVSLFYPPGHNSEKIKAGLTLKCGFDHIKIRLGVPDNFHLPVGRETFKAMVSTDETSFAWLQQGGTRSLSSSSLLQQMMSQSLQGNNTRDPIVSWGEPADDWQGINCSFELARTS